MVSDTDARDVVSTTTAVFDVDGGTAASYSAAEVGTGVFVDTPTLVSPEGSDSFAFVGASGPSEAGTYGSATIDASTGVIAYTPSVASGFGGNRRVHGVGHRRAGRDDDRDGAVRCRWRDGGELRDRSSRDERGRRHADAGFAGGRRPVRVRRRIRGGDQRGGNLRQRDDRRFDRARSLIRPRPPLGRRGRTRSRCRIPTRGA